MSKISDETLLAYADGALDPAEAAEVQRQLEDDPDAQDRLAAIERGGRLAQDAFSDALNEPVPDHLTALLLGEEKADEKAAPQADDTVVAFKPRGKPAAATRPTWQLPLAASVALVLGLGGGLAGGGLFEGDSTAGTGGLLAAGPIAPDSLLHDTLQTRASYEQAGDAATNVMPLLTFQDRNGRYCREYQVVFEGQAAAGLACHQSGGWIATAVVAFPNVEPQRGQDFATASGPAADLLATVMAAEIEGEPLDGAAEAAALAADWEE
ncbi:MAG: hypothetical protein AAFY02_19785 [Pseudomonadota bacterium]